METRTFREEPAFQLRNYGSGNRNGQSPEEKVADIFFYELRWAEAGDFFEPEEVPGCHDFVTTESLTVVFKDEHGVACLYRKEDHSYSYLEEGPDEVELIWFEYH